MIPCLMESCLKHYIQAWTTCNHGELRPACTGIRCSDLESEGRNCYGVHCSLPEEVIEDTGKILDLDPIILYQQTTLCMDQTQTGS